MTVSPTVLLCYVGKFDSLGLNIPSLKKICCTLMSVLEVSIKLKNTNWKCLIILSATSYYVQIF
jgi:hypothetical protein